LTRKADDLALKKSNAEIESSETEWEIWQNHLSEAKTGTTVIASYAQSHAI
jgi:hypothetical protein